MRFIALYYCLILLPLSYGMEEGLHCDGAVALLMTSTKGISEEEMARAMETLKLLEVEGIESDKRKEVAKALGLFFSGQGEEAREVLKGLGLSVGEIKAFEKGAVQQANRPKVKSVSGSAVVSSSSSSPGYQIDIHNLDRKFKYDNRQVGSILSQIFSNGDAGLMKFSLHSLKRMRERNISQSDVISILKLGKMDSVSWDRRSGWTYHIVNRDRSVVIAFQKGRAPIYIVTVMYDSGYRHVPFYVR